MRFDAVILAGGRASRLGGADKPGLRLGGRTLLEGSVAAAQRAGARHTIVVGPDRGTPRTLSVRENPPFGGPVAALAAALPLVEHEWMLLLAADLPRASEAVTLLLERSSPASGADGFALVDADGRPQWLVGLYRTRAVRAAVGSLGAALDGAALRTLVSVLRVTGIPDPDGVAFDVDTWQDVKHARVLAKGEAMPDQDNRDPGARVPPEALDEWIAALAERLGLDAADVPTAVLLDVARDVAHGVARPAAPLTTFLVGLAAARAGGTPEAVREAAELASGLAARWRSDGSA